MTAIPGNGSTATTITTKDANESGIEIEVTIWSAKPPRIEAIRRRKFPEPHPASLWRQVREQIARRLAPARAEPPRRYCREPHRLRL